MTNKAIFLEKNSPAQDLCNTCGLCCDGTLFKTVTLKQNERVKALKAVSAKFTTKNKERHFLQPCVAHKNLICNVYNERPESCIMYKCKLLKQCLSNEIPMEKALKTVEEAILHKTRVEEMIGEVYNTWVSKSLPENYEEFIKTLNRERDPASSKKKYGHIIVEYVAFKLRLDRYFNKKEKKK